MKNYISGTDAVNVARIAHEVNRQWCIYNGDESQPTWEDAPKWQRESAIAGVRFLIGNPKAGDSATHDAWLRTKEAEGWSYGPEKDADAKKHPCFVPYDELPVEQKFKDRLFRTIVIAAGKGLGVL